MNYQEAIKYLRSYKRNTGELSLKNLNKLLDYMDHPEKKLKFIHVAGTNGKGSTCKMLSSILRCAGLKVGLFTSPFLETENEQIQINGEVISNEDFAKVCKKVKDFTTYLMLDEIPTEFELTTAMAFQYFYDTKCDLVVLEVGLGGELDATNVIETPLVSVLTNIGIDHVDYLGTTLKEIACKKAGIIKENGIVVSYEQEKEVEEVIKLTCEERHNKLVFAEFSELKLHQENLSRQKFSYKQNTNLSLSLIGEHQRKNAAVALEVIAQLQTLGYKISENAISEGMNYVTWPGRFEVLCKQPLVILDGGHNVQCVEAFSEVLKQFIPGKKAIVILGVLADKDYKGMIPYLVPFTKRFIAVTPKNTRALPSEQLAEELSKHHPLVSHNATPVEGIMAALRDAREDDIICVIGSLYMAAEIRDCFIGE
ncbi:bifunctional folylpolyglutamate synthase/dihydrofolate synthase [Lachnoclostridium phytofermentans]|uniref:tetrahydrofolate synthase n=1 Tax=Lachnoclostridium phytofermentans (strain ATCC 700394 / DSM 18823 / ISDg) TaxID=357809 RepID=A9KNK7_LACP7|nr:folylpolyglutamate synthase/dihydrofolate synthase family protein [Lachnoclostridium phytofermentans]ABX43124.1 FolC bifunctional protein [Lachnoclostridium phytofermentans ISDg]